MSREKLQAVWLAGIVLFSVFSGVGGPGASVAAAAGNTGAGNTGTPQVEIINVGTTQSGDLTVTVRGTSSEPVEDFKFWYKDHDTGTELGPTQYGDGNFNDAYYTNASQTSFSAGDPVSTSTPDVTFVFDSFSTSYRYQTNPFRINVTAFDKSYSSAEGNNRSVFTGYHYNISAQDHDGDTLSSVPLMVYNASTNESQGFSFISSFGTKSVSFHCRGVEIDGTCTNPDNGSDGTVLDTNPNPTTYSAPISVETMSLSEANASGKVDPSRGSTTLTADQQVAATFLQTSSLSRQGSSPNVKSITITNTSSGNTVWQNTNVGGSSFLPVFLEPTETYEVTISNPSTFGTETRYLTLPTKGMSQTQFRIQTSSLSTSTVTGQVVNESGEPVSDVVVIAESEFSSGSFLDVYNSTTTDSNGLFTMRLPETDQLSNDFGFRMIGTSTSGGTPIYYPTPDANDGDGYVVQSGNTVLPPMTIKQGGRVDVNVTSGDGKLPGFAFTSLSQVSTAHPSMTRTANSNTFSAFTFSSQTPSSASVSIMSPTTGADSQVAYNVWGMQSTPRNLCANAVTVSQGAVTSSGCSLENGGLINLSVQQYRSILQQSSSTYADVESFGFFWNNELVIRNASTGDLVTYFGPDGAQQYFLNRPGSANDIEIPVPEGDYNVHLRPANDWVEQTTVNETTTISVADNATTDVQLDRGRAFPVVPVFDRVARSLTRDRDNVIAVRVFDPSTESQLTDSAAIDVSAQLRHPNGTVASDPVDLTYNSTDGSFDTTAFNPQNLGVDAGNYRIAITVSHTSSTRTYNSTTTEPIQVTGFSTGLELGVRTATPGQSVLGQIHAYDGNTGLAVDASNVSIKVYNENGRLVDSTSPSSGVTSGEGSFTLTMPDTSGRYRLATRLTTDSGEQGIAQRWIRVSQVDLSVSTSRRTYAPTDTVRVNVEASNSTDGSAIPNASVELWINNQRVTTSTDSNGQATVSLDPGTYGNGGQWARGHPVSVTLLQETPTGVVRKTAGTGFEVQAFEARAEPTANRFNSSESPKIDVFVPTDVSVTSVSLSELDGSTDVSASSTSNPASGVHRVTLSSQPVGDHVATVSIETASSGTETVTTQFAVQDNTISTSLNGRTFDTGETIELTVGVRNNSGSAVSGQSVSASLNATSPVRQVDSASGTTGTDGEVTFSLSSSASGFHFIEVTVGKQTRYLGLSVSDVSVRLEDSSGSPVSGYQVEPGTTETIYVNATKSDGTVVADGSSVSAFVTAFDDTIELGNSQTTNGEASIDVNISSSVPAREYPIVVDVTTTSGSGTTSGTLNVTGANALQIDASTNESVYSPGDTASLEATVTTGDGSPVNNRAVDFVVQSDGTAEQRVATVSTNADGVATFNHSIASDASDGQYVLRTALNDSQSVQAYDGYRVRSIDVSLDAEDGPFNPGDTVSLTLHVNDSETGNAVTATGGSLTLTLPGSNLEKSLSLSGSSPYSVSVTLPEDGRITGTRTISVSASKDQSSDSASTLIDVENSSESANLSIATPVTAGQSTTVTVNGTVDETAVLTAFSPNAGTVAYNGSVTVSSSGDTTTSMTIGAAGIHVVKMEVPGVGTVTQVVDVQAASDQPAVWTGTDLNSNTTSFSTSEDVYLKTNKSGMSATVISQNETYTVQLDQQSGSTHYGVLSADLSSGIYLVRLDSESATDVDDTIIEVGG